MLLPPALIPELGMSSASSTVLLPGMGARLSPPGWAGCNSEFHPTFPDVSHGHHRHFFKVGSAWARLSVGSVFGNRRTPSRILGAYMPLPFPAVGCDPPAEPPPGSAKGRGFGRRGRGILHPPSLRAAPGQGMLRGPSTILCHPSVCPKPSGTAQVPWMPLLELLGCGMGGVSGGSREWGQG